MLQPTVSLLTIVKGRRQNLHNLVRGVAALTRVPGELVVVHMNEPTDPDLPDPGCPLREVSIVSIGSDKLPIARARNHAAKMATGDILVFLDVDCIPAPDYLANLVPAVQATRGLVMGSPHYLPAGSARADWTTAELTRLAIPHPLLPEPPRGGVLAGQPYQLFWSLCFGLYRETFEQIGGFDESFHGYGGEDTDFAFVARAAGIPFFVVDARCYHQYHPTCTPPFNHLENIVTNANVFREKWGLWAMENWLTVFEQHGYVRWTEDELRVLRLPTQEVIDAHQSTDPFA
ncbi:glycosyltransferase family 2 protein [Neolewinella antarctica]|uniref:GT2 family glycosyltransferase n=1 Tax=Neolewinella antarctica TaxID=442734 RepID=A0ABX0X988_9BACT|nr:glycosyltransferase [Neolewinella antarctica]NJC25831.1 GT2 family glycosyltransferase [Neolewinella antarctica]